MPFVNGIKAARERIVARTDEERTEFLRKRGFSKSETAKVIETVLAEEGRKPESIFDFVQGITAVARDKPHQDARLDLEIASEEAARPGSLTPSKPATRLQFRFFRARRSSRRRPREEEGGARFVTGQEVERKPLGRPSRRNRNG